MSALISRQSTVAMVGIASFTAIGCGLTKALVQPNESKAISACICGASFVTLIVSANLSKGTDAIGAIASVFFAGVGMGFAPTPSCLQGRTWSLAGLGAAGIAACVAIQTLFRN